jgi:putative ABC transport system permease protein
MKEKKIRPPRSSRWLLRRLKTFQRNYFILGDLEEAFHEMVFERGYFIACIWFWFQTICCIPKYLEHQIYWRVTMFTNYFKIALRNIKKYKGYSFINITGLAIGMACCILILVFIVDELSFDRFHEHAEDIYRIATTGRISGVTIEVATTPALMGPTMIKDFPEVVNAVRFWDSGNTLFSSGDRRFFESGLLYADHSILDVFSFELVHGDPATALEAPYTIVVTPEIARKYFGRDDPLGEILKMNNEEDFIVTGVIEKPPSNSHFTFDLLASFETFYKRDPERMAWVGWDYHTYIQLREGVDSREFEKKLVSFNEKYIGAIVRSFGGEISNYLQPLTSIHLHSNLEGELGANGDIRYVTVFAAIGVFILMIACINFINLSTARSVNRAREVGLRKVVGAARGMLINQFLGESLFLALISMVFALVVVQIAVPHFNNLAGREIGVNTISNPWIVVGFLLIVLFAGLIAGSYPAFFLSAFKPAGVLKGKLQKGVGHSRFRSILVVFQFAVSITLIVVTGIVYNQIHFMRNKRLGFHKEQRMVILLRDDEIRQKFELIKTEMQSLEGVVSASGSRMVPGEEGFNVNPYFPEGWSSDQGLFMQGFYIDDDFLKTYGIELVAGRGFSREMSTDRESGVLINETAARRLGWTSPVGKKIHSLANAQDFSQRITFTVIGVIQDIHHRSVRHAVEPTFITYSPDYARRITLKLNSENISQTMKLIEKKWSTIGTDYPFDYFFLDDYYDGLYRSEERLGRIFRVFTLFAILIGCLGLFGLASFATEQRTKEIGIRKVLGSSSRSIILLLCREFILLVGVANVIAWPVAFFSMKKWLEGFPYQTNIHITTFIVAGLTATTIALFTVSYRAVRAARSNPVDSLRYE